MADTENAPAPTIALPTADSPPIETADGPANARARLTRAMAVLTQDANGDNTYNNSQALMGRIEASKYLMIPSDIWRRANAAGKLDVDLEKFGTTAGVEAYMGIGAAEHIAKNKYFRYSANDLELEEKAWDMTKIAAINFDSLLNAGMTHLDALYVSTLRARWIMLGALNAMMTDSPVANTINEHIIINEDHERYGKTVATTDIGELADEDAEVVDAYLEAINADEAVSEWVTYHAEALWTAVEYVFRVRGHHYKTTSSEGAAYDALYTRYLNAAYEGSFEWPPGVTKFAIFHTAIHPFKIRALPVLTAHFLAYDRVAESGKIRMHGSPCGHAVITTCVAALATMRGEAWWSAFNDTFGAAIADVSGYALQINNNKYAFHQAAGLYGVKKATVVTKGPEDKKTDVNLNDAKMDVKFVAAACQGLINALREAKDNRQIEGFALSNSKALAKAAADAPLLTARIAKLVIGAIQVVNDADGLVSLIRAALPNIAEEMAKATVE
jgi:hypothetical protein